MPYKDRQKEKAHWTARNADPAFRERQREYQQRPEVKERGRLRAAARRANHGDETRKSARVSQWKAWGVDPAPYESLGDLYDYTRTVTECEDCSVKLNVRNRQMDHCHTTNAFRAVVCSACNCRRRENDNPHYHLKSQLTRAKNNVARLEAAILNLEIV